MIPQNDKTPKETVPWQRILKESVRSTKELVKILNIDAAQQHIDTQPSFPLRVPRPFIQKMRQGDPDDPLLRQVLALEVENDIVPSYSADPLQEAQCNPTPGILQKFQSRVLLTPTSACAVHCRYCFRRHFPYDENTPSRAEWQARLKYVAQNPQINEVILSGGDPLSLTDAFLASLVGHIIAIPHIKILRLHTRFPVMIPQRITDSLCQLLSTRLKTVVVLHINHAQEIDETLIDAVQKMRRHGITVLNQSVILKGVNDDTDTLIHLSHKLFEADILPYYIHRLDKVAGAHHFDIDDKQAAHLQSKMHEALPGYLMPRWVTEVPGAPHKIIFHQSPQD